MKLTRFNCFLQTKAVALVAVMLFISFVSFACSLNEGTNSELREEAEVADVAALDDRNCSALASSDLARLRQLQTEIPYTVFVPACLPAGYQLKSGSIKKVDAYTSGVSPAGRPAYETRPTYSFSLVNGDKSIDFGGNNLGDPGKMNLEAKVVVRGYQAMVFFPDAAGGGDGVPFEKSTSFDVIWDEGKDLTGKGDLYGAYSVRGRQITWKELSQIINSMVPLDEIAVDEAVVAGNDSVNGREVDTPVNFDNPGEVIKAYLIAAENRDCQEWLELWSVAEINKTYGTSREAAISMCQHDLRDLRYEIKNLDITNVTITDDKAKVSYVVIAIDGGQEETGKGTYDLVKENGEWKVEGKTLTN